MSGAGVPKFVFVPTSVGGRQVVPTRMGVLVRTTPEGAFIVREGYPEQLNWEWSEKDETLSLQLLCGPGVRSTKVMLDGITSAALNRVLRVIRRAPPSKPSDKTFTRAQSGSAPELPGVLALLGSSLLDTPEGLARLDGFLTSGGMPRSEDAPDGQAGNVPLAARTGGRFASWSGDNSGSLSMPIRFEASAPKPTKGITTGGGLGGPINIRDGSGDKPDGVTQSRTADVRVGEQIVATGLPTNEARALVEKIRDLADQQAAALQAVQDAFQAGWDESDPAAVKKKQAELNALGEKVKEINKQLAALGVDMSGSKAGAVTAPGALDISGDGGSTGGGAKSAANITADAKSGNFVEVWGSMDPMDILKIEALDPENRGKDPESYQGFARWAPHFYIDVDKLAGEIGDPPPEDDGDPPPERPKTGGGGGGGGEDDDKDKDEDKDKPDPQNQRARDTHGQPGQQPTGSAIAFAATAGPVTDSISTGTAGVTISAQKDGITRIDGEDQDVQDSGQNDPPPSNEVEVTPDGRFIKVYKDGRVVRVQRTSGGVLTGAPVTVGDVSPPAECPIGNKGDGGTTVEDDGRRVKTYDKNGNLLTDRLKKGGILGPGADGATGGTRLL